MYVSPEVERVVISGYKWLLVLFGIYFNRNSSLNGLQVYFKPFCELLDFKVETFHIQCFDNLGL